MLGQYVALGYNPNNNNVCETLIRDISDGGIFSFDKIDKINIEKINFCGHNNLQTKILEMVSYIIEIGYNIAICPRDNISDSPWIEPLLGTILG